jgi:integrase
MAAASTSLRCWLLLCSDLAMRNATAARICPNDYDRERGTITFRTKFGTCQTLPVTAELASLFAKVPADADGSIAYVVHLAKGGRMKHPGLAFYDLRRKLKIARQITAHDLRRTTATAIYNQTADLRKVQAVLGHKQLSTTLHYLDHRNTPVELSTLELAKLNPTTEAIQ